MPGRFIAFRLASVPLLVLLICLAALSGCVTSHSHEGDNHPAALEKTGKKPESATESAVERYGAIRAKIHIENARIAARIHAEESAAGTFE